MRIATATVLTLVLASCGSGTHKGTDGGGRDSTGTGGGVVGSGGSGGGRGGTGGSGNGGSTGSGGAGTAGSAGTGGLGGGAGSAGRIGSGGAAGRGSGGAGGGAGGANTAAVCPASLPANGAACTGDASCTFGEDPSLPCRPRARCLGGSWAVTPPPAYCTAPLDPACPATGPASQQCTAVGTTCFYSPALCGCSPCACNVPGCYPSCGALPTNTPVWSCAPQRQGAPPCPAVLPNDGAPCTLPEDTACPASSCFAESGYDIRCTGGVWRWTTKSMCPVCASPDTPIATPEGERPIASLRAGDVVYSVEGSAIRPVAIARVNRTPVVGHHVVRLVTADGRVLEISAGHPTADGRTFADLRAGDRLDGRTIESASSIPYPFTETYDILPLSSTGTYFAAGMLIGSTLK